MTNLPDHEPQRIAEGYYQFQVVEEPELRKKESAATGKEFVSIKFSFKLIDRDDNISYHKESFIPWDTRYGELLLALGAKKDKSGKVHLSEQGSIVGKIFEAEIKHEPDKNDSSKTWARIANISVEGKKPEKIEAEEEDQDIPF